MTAPLGRSSILARWEEQGARIAGMLDGCAAAVVLGDDPSAAAHVALGIGRAQASHRRVVVVDLVGEIPAIQERLPSNAPHGLADALQYGVSLAKISYRVDPASDLVIIPSGVGELDYGTLLQNARWRALMRTFRDAGALVLLVAPASSPPFSGLLRRTDGAIVVEDAPVDGERRVIARIAASRVRMEREPAEHESHATSESGAAPRSRGLAPWLTLALAAALVALGAVKWFTRASRPDGPMLATAEHDGAFARDTSSTAQPAPRRVVPIANPADSAMAAAYAVTLVTYNTASAAEAQVDRGNQQGLPAITVSYVALGADSSRWYRVFVGAYQSRAAADSLLHTMRGRGLLAPAAGRVVHAPLAIRVRDHLVDAEAHTIATGYRARGIPVYALIQDDGTLTLYAGAFETPDQAASLLSILRAAGEAPVVVYRTGRVL